VHSNLDSSFAFTLPFQTHITLLPSFTYTKQNSLFRAHHESGFQYYAHQARDLGQGTPN
jgi:hypothetical protein